MNPTAMDGSDEENPDQEDAVEEQLYKAQRIHVDVLLEMSEEAFLKETEPHEYHCYCGWEEAVRGWDRVAPVSCILLPQKKDKKPKPRKDTTDNPPSTHAETIHGDTLAMSGEHCGESQSSPHYSKKSTPSSQKAIIEPESPEWHAMDGAEEDSSHLLHEERSHVSGIPLHLQHLPSNMTKGRQPKPMKRQTKSKVVPITNFTFLPPIK
ncbi:uncharacterized protein LOC127599533 isoform X2 [Hippocampus zosterae]|uniref:uncharacterized protein LOC127599533 isoform X2 n=1 Tax=Hippocampus zosterae TaxID=109293 RepID=UPI00223D442E|nr:uncharacterized protein LOC127599533 isoform X2 [Hippocampus zosterae]